MVKDIDTEMRSKGSARNLRKQSLKGYALGKSPADTFNADENEDKRDVVSRFIGSKQTEGRLKRQGDQYHGLNNGREGYKFRRKWR